jgi:hypothetical protein
MARVSFTAVWDQTRAFVAKELSLLAPVALSCFALPLLLLTMVMPEPPTAPTMNKPPTLDARVFWFIPLILIQIFGWMTLVSLALVPAISVGEGLRRALARMPIALGVLAILAVVSFIVISITGIVTAVISMAAGSGKNGTFSIAVMLLAVILLVMMIRLSVLWPAVVDGHDGPIKTLQRTLRLTDGEFWRLLGLLLLATAVSIVLSLTARLAGGSVMLLIGRMAHSEALGRMLASLLEAIVVSLWQMVTVIYVAFLYRAFAKTGKAD